MNRPPLAARQNPQRSMPRLPIGIAVAVVMVVAAVGAYFLLRPPAGNATTGNAVTGNTTADNQGVFEASEGQTHVPEGSAIQYANNPPSSGNHYPSPKPWGVYTDTIAPGYWVHNLEHGGVVVLYDCPQGCPEVTQTVQQALQSFPKDKHQEVKLVSTPYSGLPNGAKTAVVAWQWVKTYPGSITYDQLLAFYNSHVDRSPEDVP
jgi:hypothetical protein